MRSSDWSSDVCSSDLENAVIGFLGAGMRRRRRGTPGTAEAAPDARCAGSSCLETGRRRRLLRQILRKEVIQPQVPLRLPCYDFTPVADPTVVGCQIGRAHV